LGGGLVGRHLKIHDPLLSSLPSVRNEEILQKAAKTAKVDCVWAVVWLEGI
jgi:hypothetical protein